MTEIRETLRLTDFNIDELNRIMGRVQDRLDALEGLRGEPAFYSNVNMRSNNINNVGSMNASSVYSIAISAGQINVDSISIADVTAGTAVFTQPILFSDTVNFQSTVTITDKLIIPYHQASSQPTLEDNEIVLWKNTSTTKYYLVASFNGIAKKIELT